MAVRFTVTGSTKRTQKFLNNVGRSSLYSNLDRLAQKGVTALSSATPVESGLTGMSWSYEIEVKDGAVTISWLNTNRNNGVNVAVILQYGHATGTGGYVAGRDYINPAIAPTFNEIAEEVWRRVKQA